MDLLSNYFGVTSTVPLRRIVMVMININFKAAASTENKSRYSEENPGKPLNYRSRSCLSTWLSLPPHFFLIVYFLSQSLSFLSSTEFVCKAVADVAFIVDSSGSIGRRNWVKMLQFLKDLVKAFNVGPQKTHIAVVAYSTNANVEFRFNRLTGSAVSEEGYNGLIDRIRFQRGFTFIDKALKLANEQIFSTNFGMRPALPQVWKVYATRTFSFHIVWKGKTVHVVMWYNLRFDQNTY